VTGLEPASAVFLASAVVLGVAGVAKAIKPADTSRALHIAGLPDRPWMVRSGGAAELAVAVFAVALPGALTGAVVACSYASFAVFVAVALRRGWPLSSCGCFGRPDSRPGLAHLVLNLAATAGACWWAADPPAGGWRIVDDQSWDGIALLVVTLVVAELAYLVWTRPARSLAVDTSA